MDFGVEHYRKSRTGRTFSKNPPITRVSNTVFPCKEKQVEPENPGKSSIEMAKNTVKAELDSMGVKYHPRLGLKKLETLLADSREGDR